MKYYLLSVSKSPKLLGVNIGDYVQALASSQYYPQIDGFLDRDKDLKSYEGEPCKMIMNGWYMHNPENWPPSDKIDPLYVAFHLNSKAKETLLSKDSIDYLKKHQPIGCRDLNTLDILQSQGVDAYFSGCMTLTLGKKFHSDIKENKTYIVDPLYNGEINTCNVIRALKEFVLHPCDIIRLCNKDQLYVHHGRNFIMKFLKTALYYKEYTKVFGRKIVMDSTYVCQEDEYYTNHFLTDKDRLDEAERLIRLYAKAQLVITSRIHCALPCTGIETPVIYLENAQDFEASSCRLGGLRELFNVVKVDKGSLVPQFETSLPIDANNHPANKNTWEKLVKVLDEKCTEFMKM